MRIVRESLKPEEIQALTKASPFKNMIKVVVDLEREILVAGGELHSDGEALLLEDGSKQRDLWGANVYPLKPPAERIVYSSLINQYHAANKRNQIIQDPRTQERVRAVIERYFGNV